MSGQRGTKLRLPLPKFDSQGRLFDRQAVGQACPPLTWMAR